MISGGAAPVGRFSRSPITTAIAARGARVFAFFLALGIAFIVVGFFGLIRVTDWRDRPKGVVQLPAKPVETFLAEEIITRTRRVKATRG